MLRTTAAAFAALSWGVCASVCAQPVTSREQLNGVLWFQTSPERQALSRQAYAAATAALPKLWTARQQSASLEQKAEGRFGSKDAAIVLDIDETVLDNSPYNAGLVLTGDSYRDSTWHEWVLARRAEALPGAAEFIEKARKTGFRIVYVSNRLCDKAGARDENGWSTNCPQLEATIDNLEKVLGYRPAPLDVLLRYKHASWTDSDKALRRKAVAQNYRIAMLIGDDLGDFAPVASYSANAHRQRWGSTWFALPNPMYGSWEKPFLGDVPARYKSLNTWLPKSEPLKIASWNMEWLVLPAALDAADFWSTCAARGWPNEKLQPDLPYCNVIKDDGVTSAAEYEAKKLKPLRETLANMAAEGLDLLAVQEVQSAQALANVLPSGFSVKCFTARVDPQNIGVAIRDSAAFSVDCKEVQPLSLEQVPDVPPVRRGLELSLSTGGKSFKLLNVHLKSRCVQGRMTAATEHCPILQRQVEHLEAWVEAQGRADVPFMVIGDWNRDIEEEVRHGHTARSDQSDPKAPVEWQKVANLFPELNDGEPTGSKMALVPVDRRAAAFKACHEVLDQVVVSDSLVQLLDPASLIAGRTVPASLQLGKKGSSDHCRLETTLVFK